MSSDCRNRAIRSLGGSPSGCETERTSATSFSAARRWLSSSIAFRPPNSVKSSFGWATSTVVLPSSPTGKYRLMIRVPTMLGWSGLRSVNWP